MGERRGKGEDLKDSLFKAKEFLDAEKSGVSDEIGGGSGDHKGRPYAIRKDSMLLSFKCL